MNYHYMDMLLKEAEDGALLRKTSRVLLSVRTKAHAHSAIVYARLAIKKLHHYKAKAIVSGWINDLHMYADAKPTSSIPLRFIKRG